MTPSDSGHPAAQRPRIGIFGGSFNPVHIGHLMIASYLRQWASLDEVWLTLSPLNPLKSHPSELIPDFQRLEMLRIATAPLPDIGMCDIELSMPRPSYTVDTLRLLARRYPRKEFCLIIGSDNWRIFEQWRDYRYILDNFRIIIYPRPGYPLDTIYESNVETVKAPQITISSTFIRAATARGRDMTCFCPPGVFDFIKEQHLYISPNTTE